MMSARTRHNVEVPAVVQKPRTSRPSTAAVAAVVAAAPAQPKQTAADIVINERFLLGNRIAEGSFGSIYRAEDLSTGNKVAIKLEKRSARINQLLKEARIWRDVLSRSNSTSNVPIPTYVWHGTEGDFNVLVTELMGPCLESLFDICKRKFSTKTVAMLGIQMLAGIQFLQQNGYVHSDIKPDNFVMGSGNKTNLAHIIDFGLSNQYTCNGRHNPQRPPQGYNALVGTARYASVNAMKGGTHSRRDDIESLAYCLVYFAKGKLPWQGTQGASRTERYAQIAKIKQTTSPQQLCEGLPEEFALFVDHARQLQFSQSPDYQYLTGLLQQVLHKQNEKMDYVYDWTKMASTSKRSSSTPTPQPQQQQQQSQAQQQQQQQQQQHTGYHYNTQAQDFQTYGGYPTTDAFASFYNKCYSGNTVLSQATDGAGSVGVLSQGAISISSLSAPHSINTTAQAYAPRYSGSLSYGYAAPSYGMAWGSSFPGRMY